MTPRLSALGALLGRYGSVFQAAWSQRRAMQTPARPAHELAFLPAQLELADTPVHPAARWAQRIIVALALCVLLIAVFGQLDIVVTAPGRFIPDARVKVIQPALTGVVRSIAVRDGQRVKAGEQLMELDTTQAAADADKARQSKFDAQLAAARARALLAAERAHRPPSVARIDGASDERQTDAQRLADGLYREFIDKQSSAQAELQRREAELASTRVQIAKLQATAPLARQQAKDYAKLVAGHFVAQHDYLAKEQVALEQEHDLGVQQAHAREVEAAITQQRADLAALVSQFRREQLDALNRAMERIAQDRNDETKATTRERLLRLSSPVDGTVQQLAVHTVGGVVTTAQSLMEIVPDDALEIEVRLENKDIGFVHVGQDAVVKVDAFPYTRYGYLRGKVTSVSNDAVQDRKLGLVFVAQVRVDANRIRANDKWIALTPGMSVRAEILTGRRSVARYFLDPLIQTTQESLRER